MNSRCTSQQPGEVHGCGEAVSSEPSEGYITSVIVDNSVAVFGSSVLFHFDFKWEHSFCQSLEMLS